MAGPDEMSSSPATLAETGSVLHSRSKVQEDAGLQVNSKVSNSGIEVADITPALSKNEENPLNITNTSQSNTQAPQYSRILPNPGGTVDGLDYPPSPIQAFQELRSIPSNVPSEAINASRQASTIAGSENAPRFQIRHENQQSPRSSTLIPIRDHPDQGNRRQETSAQQSLAQSSTELVGTDIEKQPVERSTRVKRSKLRGINFHFLHGAIPQRRWRFTVVGIIACLAAIIVALAILFANKKHGTTVSITNILTVTSFQPSEVLPVSGSSLGARDVILGTYFSNSITEKPQTKVVWDAGNGRLCVKTKLGATWLLNVDCVDGAKPKKNTPITLVDWLGGPSIGYLTEENYLSSINFAPAGTPVSVPATL